MALQITVVDESTGEIHLSSPRRRFNPHQPRWIKVFADNFFALIADPELRDPDIRVLSYLICHMDRENLVVCRSRYIAEDLHCSHSGVNHSLQRLCAKGAVIRLDNGVYRVAHKVAWRASTLRWSEVNSAQ